MYIYKCKEIHSNFAQYISLKTESRNNNFSKNIFIYKNMSNAHRLTVTNGNLATVR